MKKIAIVLAAASLVSLAACKQAPTTENSANMMEANMANEAAAMDAEANADANNAMMNATDNASAASLDNKTDSIRAEAEAARNTH